MLRRTLLNLLPAFGLRNLNLKSKKEKIYSSKELDEASKRLGYRASLEVDRLCCEILYKNF